MSRFWSLLTDVRVLCVLGFLALAAFLFIGADTLSIALVWAGVALGVALLLWFVVWAVKRYRARKAAQGLEQALEQQGERAAKNAPSAAKADVQALRTRMSAAVKTIKTSRLGQLSGSAALYELPWYMVIGNPAAGKSTAVVRSGLKFPFAEQTDNIIQGIGGTRNCDWFFTSEGILLDTAGRYAVHEEDREEWRGFLSLLKKHRPKAPINGILIAASVADVVGSRPDFAITLAKQLRQRVQELTEQLEVFAPVYIMFTKADLIAGFAEFFEDRDPSERDRVWGATLPYQADGRIDAIAQFDTRFDELFAGLKDMSVTRMSMHRGEGLPPGVLTFPLEFAALKPALRSFIGTLFEDNPYQYRPIFRGFYFTSSVQEGSSNSRASERIAQQFALDLKPRTTAAVYSQNGFFLKDLFQKVIFADRHLVRQHASRTKLRLRYGVFAASVVALGVVLGGWAWSYAGNRQLLANVDADVAKAAKLQKERTDLQSRIEALEILQDRIEQLHAWRDSRPLGVSLGLYQGDAVERKLRDEYFAGVREVMLGPVAESIEAYLTEVNTHADQLQPVSRTPASGAPNVQAVRVSAPGSYQAASTESVEDAYNALKTYLMLGDRARMEQGHLADQITRFWRGWLEANRGTMPREQLIRSAERMLSFVLAQTADPTFPQLKNNITLVDTTRENLRRVVRGMPARERVYSEIKSRASTRFAPMTVARIVGEQDREVVAGSYSINGAFTRDAWDKYIEAAFKEAASKDLQSTDWVLKTAAHDDLTLEGSPEQIQKALVQMYKTEYVAEWQKFLRGITVNEFGGFDNAVARMNRLGDPTGSPVYKVLDTLYNETSWDNPSLLNERLKDTQRGFTQWFKQVILRQAPSRVEVDLKVGGPQAEIPMGPIGKEFAGVMRLMNSRSDGASLSKTYLEHLSKIRTKFNQIKNQGDPGPAARTLMAQTLDGSGSDLSEALRFVDEQMLVGMSDSAKAALRPLLVRPLMQAFATLVPSAEAEVNRLWTAQIYEPFQRSLAPKYPFDTGSRVEAAPAEIAKMFGPDGAIAKFQGEALGTLVLRRGDEITPRQWAEMGLRLNSEFTSQFTHWVAPLNGAGGSAASGGGAAETQTRFQIQPMPISGLSEYTLEIDGQQLRYRNSAPAWSDFVWPGPKPGGGVRITGVAFDGRTIEFLNEPGGFGLERMVAMAQRKRLEPSLFELTWPKDKLAVTVKLRIVSTPGQVTSSGASAESASGANSLRGMKLPATVTQAIAPAPAASAPPAAPARPASGVVVAQGAAR
ncbi:type VI secretion system membrane subunit TssM [Ideonella sp. BN130291]|uniref:type VI secretion system membrane subunit TssM n=1 Tax=Ideonella sp. BN130291 TaxID=3112940 RepID=UPI002E252A15|nr:type VI secretion system membrane subunit TssM [Ideonella sp. BN130291]